MVHCKTSPYPKNKISTSSCRFIASDKACLTLISLNLGFSKLNPKYVNPKLGLFKISKLFLKATI